MFGVGCREEYIINIGNKKRFSDNKMQFSPIILLIGDDSPVHIRKLLRKTVSFILTFALTISSFVGGQLINKTYAAVPQTWIEITDAAGLAAIDEDPTANYKLMSNITLTGNWTPLGTFTGKLDGNGKVIRNLTISDTTLASAGLFSEVGAGAQIYNLGIEGANITAGDDTGILAGVNNGTIAKVYAKGSVAGRDKVGGLVGDNAATIDNCYADAEVSGRDMLGGLVGANSDTVNQSYSASQVAGSVFNNYLEFDGASGYISIPHHASYATGTFTLEAWFQWDDVDKPEGTDPNAYVDFIIGKGVEQFEIHTEGGSGRNGLRFIPITNVGGDSYLDIKNVLQPGWFHVAAVYSYSEANKEATASFFINGVAQDIWQKGVNVGKVATMHRDSAPPTNTNAINIGRRTDNTYCFAGKIADVRFWNVARSEEDIAVNKDKKLTGSEPGLVGYWKLDEEAGPAIDSTSNGNNGTLIGGVTRSSEAASVNKGGLVGSNSGTVADSYYDSTVSQQSDIGKGEAAATGLMKDQDTFTGWDFTDTWGLAGDVNNGYPYLKSSGKDITAFSFNGLSPAVTGVIYKPGNTISITVPHGTNITTLAATITHTGKSISPAAGVHNFTSPVTYMVTAEDNSTKTYTVTVTVAPGTVNNTGGHSSNTNNQVEVIVNGESELKATLEVKVTDNQKITTVTVEQKDIEQMLTTEGNNATLVIPVNNQSDVVVGELNGQTVKSMEAKQAVLQIKTENVTYTVPATQINIDNVSAQIGNQVELKDIKVSITVAEPSTATVKVVEDTANRNNYQIVAKPVEFNITCTNGNKTIEVSKFNGYVERIVAIPAGVDPSKITTGVVLNADGTFSHVPTAIMMIDGKYYAKINSLTNSSYAVIYNPVNVAAVEKHWSKAAVNDLASRLVIDNPEGFNPNAAITRGEFAEYIIKVLGLYRTEIKTPSKFKDVDNQNPWAAAITLATEYGVITGYADGSFRPYAKITREEAMTMCGRAMDIAELLTVDNNAIQGYQDKSDVAAWAYASVREVVSARLFNGKTINKLAPKDTLTYAEAATAIRDLVVKAGLI